MKPGIVLESQNPQLSFTHYLFKTLIGSDGRSETLEMAFKVFSEVQAIGMLVNFSFNVLSATDVDALGLFVQKIAKYVSFDNLFSFDKSSPINNVLYGFFLAYMVFMLAIAGLLTNSYYTRSRNNTYLISIWKNLGIIHYTAVFLFIYQFMLLLVNSESDATFYLWVSNFPLPFFIIACLVVVVAAVFAAFFCKFLYEPLRTNYILASRTSTADLLLLLYKVVDPPLDLFLTDLSVRRWMRAALIIVIFAARLKVFIFDAPYFYKTPMKLFWRFAFVQFAMSLVNLVMLIIGTSKSDTQNYEVVYMGIVITAFFPKISDTILHHRIKYYSSKDHDTIKNVNGFHWRLFALEAVVTDGAVSSKAQKRSRDCDYEFMLYGVVSTHKKRCNKGGCTCKLILRSNDLSNNSSKDKNTTNNFIKEKEMFQGLKFELIKELYREGAKRLPFDTEIKIGLANLIFENKFRSYAPSISLIHTMNLTEQSTIKRVIAIALLEKIEKKLISDYDNSVNIKEIVDFQSASQRLRALIEANIVKFLAFWETYKSPDPSVVKLYSCSTHLNKEADEIASTWNMIISKYKRLAYSDHLIYGLYLSLIRSAPYSAEKALQTYFSYIKSYDPEKNREYQLLPENVHEAKNILVCISMKREKLGTVTFITSNVEETLNYKQSEIVGKDVNVMMPGFYQERHKRILLAHVENSRTSIFNRNRPVFIRNKAGYIIPCNIYVTMFPYFQGQLLYLGVLRPTNIYDDFILVLSDGTIDCFTENVGKVLGLTSSHRRYNLIDISRELSKLHKALLPYGASTELKWKSSFTKKRTRDGYVDSSYSMKSMKSAKSARSQATYRDVQSDVVKDKEEEEDGSKSSRSTARLNSVDLGKTYELFTTTGVTVGFYKVNSVKGESTRFEYNTILTEEHILGSHLRIFRLQTSSEGEDVVQQNNTAANSKRDVMETFNDDAFTASLDKKKTQQSRMPTEQSIRMTCPEDAGIGAKAEDDMHFKNPFYKKVTIDEGSFRNGAHSAIHIEPFNIVKNNDSDPLKNSETRAGDSTPVTNNNRSNSLGIKKEATTSRGKTNPAEENSEMQQVVEKDKKLEKGQLKKFLKENQIIIGEDGADKNSVTSQTRADKINSKLERAIYLNETEFSIFILTWSIVCFCGLSVGMVIYFHIVTQSYLGHVNVNMNVFETLYERANQVVEIDRKARMIYIFQEGLAPVARHTTDDEIAEQTALQTNAVDLSTQNNDLRNAYHSIHVSTQDIFYQPIDVYSKEEPAKTRIMNTFDLCTEISASALELYDMRPTKPDPEDSNLQYILNNSFRGMLQVNQDIADVLMDLNDDSISSIESTIISIIIIRISCGFMIFVFVIKIEASFLKMRSRFLEAFLTIKDHEVEQSIYIVNTFLVYLKENRKGDYLVDKITNSKSMSQAKLANYKKLQHKGFKAKKATLNGINVPVFFNFLFTSICLSVFVILLSILLRIFAIYRESIDDTRQNVINAKVNLYKFGLVFTSLYEYISENEQTMVGDMTISEELEINYDYLSAANNDMATFMKSGKAYNTEISYLLTGDLCAELFAGQACYNVSAGVVSKGLLAMNDYMLQAIQTVKNFYDSSSKTTAAEILVAQQQALVLKDLIAAEDLWNNFIITTYGELNKALRSQYRTIANNFSVTNLAFLIFAVVTCLSLTKFLFMLVRTRMEDERKGYKNFMRIIPITIIMNNRFLKNYLLTNSKRLLESVKNRI